MNTPTYGRNWYPNVFFKGIGYRLWLNSSLVNVGFPDFYRFFPAVFTLILFRFLLLWSRNSIWKSGGLKKYPLGYALFERAFRISVDMGSNPIGSIYIEKKSYGCGFCHAFRSKSIWVCGLVRSSTRLLWRAFLACTEIPGIRGFKSHQTH